MPVHATLQRLFLLLLLAGGGWTLSAQELNVRELLIPTPFDTLSTDVVVARVGPESITAREFFFSYLFGPSFVKKRPDSRRRHLDFMIYEKLLALGGRSNGKEGDPRVAGNLAAVEGDMATEELYRDDVLSTVRLTDGEIAKAVQGDRVEVTVRWLYVPDRAAADGLMHTLQAGTSFDSLFQLQCADSSISPDDRSMTVTMFQLLRRNAPMAQIVEQLSVGKPSGAVQGPDGWYIVQVDSQWVNAVTTASAEAEAETNARQALMQMKADSLSGVYTQTIMLDADPVIQRRAFDILRAHLGIQLLPPERFEAWGLADRFRAENDSVDYVRADSTASLPLITMRVGIITLGEFLQWYRLRELNLKLRLTSPEAFFLSLEDLVWRMVRDELLVRRAMNRRLEERPGVVVQKRWWRDKLLYQVAKDSLRRTITWSDSTLQDWYVQHPGSFRDSAGVVRPYDEVRDDVLREWYERALSERLLRALTRLKAQYPVSVDEHNLRRIPVDAEHDPRAIDVVVAKKGGTFPRPAFPTIDVFWQTWQ